MIRLYITFAFLFVVGMKSIAQQTGGIELEGYDYPYPVHYFNTTVQHQQVRMAYMDIASPQPNGHTVILLHGKNFPAAYWKQTISVLTVAGYRVIAPDALGFGKSSKPILQYSFALLASLDKALLDTLSIQKVSVIGHSMGGMIAARFTLSYPASVEKLILEDPLGLEDWRAKGAPVQSVDALYAGEKKATYESILKYHQTYYYPVWQAAYQEWVDVQARFLGQKNTDQYAFVSALTTDMIFTQPVLYEFGSIHVPTWVVVGKEDKTKVVKAAPDSVMQRLGNYKELGKKTAAAIPHAVLVEYDGVGHIPHIQIPAQFHKDLLAFLQKK